LILDAKASKSSTGSATSLAGAGSIGRNFSAEPGISDPHLRAALASAELPFYTASADGRISFTNPAFRALLGPGMQADPGQLVSTLSPISDIFRRVSGDESEFKLSQSFMILGELRHYLGHHRRIVDASGNVAVVGFYVDVSEQRRAEQRAARFEERFDDLARSVSDWVWETDARMNFTYASLSIAKVLGLPPQVLKGKYLFGFGCFEDAGEEVPPLAELIRSRIPFRHRRFVIRPAEGGEACYVQLSGVPMFDDGTGGFVGYRGTGTDVTRIVLAERERLASREVIEKANRELTEKSDHLTRALAQARAAIEAKAQFLSRMSHELRTPLNAIIGFSEAARTRLFGALDERYVDYFEKITGAGQHLLALIEKVLDASRIGSGKLEIEPCATGLRDVMERALGSIEPRAKSKRISIAAPPRADDWLILADPARIHQVLVNVLDNAVKFTEPCGRIAVECQHGSDGMIDIVVSDSGVGIPAAQIELVFEHFHQVNGECHHAGEGGLGLGLAISRRLARMMQGDVFVESEVGRGSRVTIRIPAADADA
jgi:PAS domain S-box-containing protein